MRAPHEIRRQILHLRDVKKLTTVLICKRARVSRNHVIDCFNMKASEDVLRKLDAFLDAPKLHERARDQTLVEYEIEKLGREVFREYKLRTLHPNVIATWDHDRQRKYLNQITWRGKALLQGKVLREHNIVVKVPDGATYWQYKKRCLHRIQGEEAIRTGDRDSRRVPWPRPIRQERPL